MTYKHTYKLSKSTYRVFELLTNLSNTVDANGRMNLCTFSAKKERFDANDILHSSLFSSSDYYSSSPTELATHGIPASGQITVT